jgi:hypothetical protein
MSSSAFGPRPRTVEHDGHAVIEPVLDLAERAVTGGTTRDVDRMLAEAEQNLAVLKQEFPSWMASELSDFEEAWKLYKSGQPDGPKLLFRKSHDMRGQASTFGFPLAGRAADNLCRLLDAIETVPESIIEAHIQTIRVIIRQNINVEDHPIGIEMVGSLEKLGYGLIKKALDSAAG